MNGNYYLLTCILEQPFFSGRAGPSIISVFSEFCDLAVVFLWSPEVSLVHVYSRSSPPQAFVVLVDQRNICDLDQHAIILIPRR